MKNLFIFVGPEKAFKDYHWGRENETLVKIDIDNSLALGWKKEDIMLVLNFDYEYRGVKSIVVPDSLFCDYAYTSTKIFTIIYLMEKGIIGDDWYWFHDFDAFQLEPITIEELELPKGVTFALTDYGKTVINEFRDRRWSTGSIFFNKKAKWVFEMIRDKVVQYKNIKASNEEVMLLMLTNKNKGNINSAIKKINITYNVATRRRDVPACWEMANKPLKVIHFHPFDRRPLDCDPGSDNISMCVYGKNRLHQVMVNDRLIKLFKEYKII
jgi:hypothetical protein